jgi:MFS family permease
MQVGDTAKTNIKVGLGLTQTEFGIITGTAFTFVNGFMGLVWGHLADKNERKWPLLVCCVFFTLASICIAFCRKFYQVLISRIIFAIFMSSNVPLSVSLLCDYVEPHERGRAQSVYAMGMYLGVGLSSLSELLDEKMGWRNAIVTIGLISMAIAWLNIFLTEPKRNEKSRDLIVR